MALFVQVVDPAHELGYLYRLDVEVDDESLLPAARQHAMQLDIIARVDFLMRHVRRHVDEVTWAGFGDKLKVVAPSQSCRTIDHIDDTFEVTMVVSARLCLGVDGHRTSPKLCGAGAFSSYGGTPVHTERLCRPIIELVATNDSYTVRSPAIGAFAHMRSPYL